MCHTTIDRPARRLALIAASCLAAGGCDRGLWSLDDNLPPTANAIVITAINRTEYPLDPEFYVGPLADGRDTLFSEANRRTDFGFGGLGLIEPGKQVSFSVTCGQPVYVATRGGIFGQDLTAPLDQGDMIILEQDVNVRCGQAVVFTFRASANQLLTSYSVAAQE